MNRKRKTKIQPRKRARAKPSRWSKGKPAFVVETIVQPNRNTRELRLALVAAVDQAVAGVFERFGGGNSQTQARQLGWCHMMGMKP